MHLTGTREGWLAARLTLVKEEKELTRPSDELGWRRQELADLLQGRSQFLVYYVFRLDDKAGCPFCPSMADGFNGIAVSLANHDVMPWAVSRAPFAKLQAYKQRMGWTFPGTPSAGSDFNVSFAELQQREGTVEYNYQRGGHALDAITVPEPFALFASMGGTDAPTYALDRPGASVFALEDGVVYHAYATYVRGLDRLWGMYQWLDRAPKGRSQAAAWLRRHDEYKG
jgi:predicted dithiol-disulfide oxidoreductase (DUF899 family)